MKPPLIIFSAWWSLVLLILSLFTPLASHFFDELNMSFHIKSLIADVVLEGVVNGILIVKFFAPQFITLFERLLSFASSVLTFMEFDESSSLCESEKLSSVLSNSIVIFVDSSSYKPKKKEKKIKKGIRRSCTHTIFRN